MTLVISLAVICAIIAALFTIPVPLGFSFTISEHRAQGTPKYPLFSAGWWNMSFPIGARVSGSWSSENSTTVGFFIETSNLNWFYFMNSTAGSFSFTASHVYYLFAASSYSTPVSVHVSGTYAMPLL